MDKQLEVCHLNGKHQDEVFLGLDVTSFQFQSMLGAALYHIGLESSGSSGQRGVSCRRPGFELSVHTAWDCWGSSDCPSLG